MKLGDVLKLGVSTSININDSEEYTIAGVSSYGLGVKNRRNEFGKDLKMKKYQVIEKDYLMWCKVDTKNGAFGVTKEEHIGSLASSNMALAQIDTSKVYPEFLEFLFRFQPFHENITHLSSGSTNRKYLTPQQLCEQIEIPDLSLSEQLNFLQIQNEIQSIGLNKEITHQLDLIKNLRQAFLREAMQGLLVSNETSDNKTGADLLAEIQAEKAQLVKEKKIKKPKPLAPITEDEIPFDIPENWKWCRLGEVIELKSGQDLTPSQYNDKGDGIPYITGASNLENEEVIINRWTETPKSIAEKGELLITCKGTIGKMTVLQIDKVHIARQLMSIRDIYSINIIYYIQNILRLSINSFQERSKSLIPGIDREMVLNEIIPLPPLEIQERIVAKLDELMGYCDALEEQVKQSQQTNELLLQQVLREALGA